MNITKLLGLVIFPICLAMGLVDGFEWAHYAAMVWAWLMLLPSALLLTDEAVSNLVFSGGDTNAGALAASRLVAWFALGVFVAHGHYATAAAWALVMLFGTVTEHRVNAWRRMGL